MARGGYIKLYRGILDWEWFQDSTAYRLFTLLLLLANTEDKRWQGIDIKRGELVTSSESLAKTLNVGRTQVRGALKKLECSEITSRVTNKYTLIRINNYEVYQAKENEAIEEEQQEQPASQPTSNQQVTNNRPTSNQQVTTIKKHKKHKKQEETEEVVITPISPSSEKSNYADHVRLTLKDYEYLANEVGEAGARRCIEILDGYKESTGKVYQSDIGAMRNWVVKRVRKEQAEDRASPAVKETNQDRNSRILKDMYAKAVKEEQELGSKQGTDDTASGADKYQLPGEQVPDK